MSMPDDPVAPPPSVDPPTEAVSDHLPPAAPPEPAANGEAEPVAAAHNVAAKVGGVKRAALWTLIGYLGAQLIRFVSQVFLADLVLPDVFGLVAMVYAFMTGLHMFTDVGIATSLIQSKRGDEPDFYNTAWSLQILRGCLLWLGTVLIAWPVSLAFHEPLLMWLLPAVGFNSFVEGFSSTSLPTLNRHLRRERYIILDLSTSVVGAATTIAYAKWVQPTAWAMVFGPMVNFFLMMAISHFILPGYRNHLRWDRMAVGELLHFGKWIFIGTICTFLAFQASPLIVGAFLNLDRTPKEAEAQLGVYAIGANFVGIATSLVGALATQLVFPLYSRWHQEGRDIRREFVRIHCAAAGVAALLATGMLATGPAAIRTIYRPDYQAAGWIMQYLAVGAWFSMLEGNVGALLLALGQPRSVMLSNATKLAGLVVFLPLGFWLGREYGGDEWALQGLLCGFVVSDFARYLMVLGLARANGLSGGLYDLGLSLLIVVIAPLGYWLGNQGACELLGATPQTRWEYLLLFVCQGVLVTAVWGVLGLAWWRRSKVVLRPQEAV
jgi:O-antigen/teichoic acid export membrane protein